MIRYFDTENMTDNNYCDILHNGMIEIPDDGKPYGLIDGKVSDISNTEEYLNIQKENNRLNQISTLKKELADLDIKSIRALREPSLKDTENGITWLNFYQNEITNKRNQLQSLLIKE